MTSIGTITVDITCTFIKPSPETGTTNNTLAIALGAGIGGGVFLIIIIVFIVVCCLRRRPGSQKVSSTQIEIIAKSNARSKVQTYPLTSDNEDGRNTAMSNSRQPEQTLTMETLVREDQPSDGDKSTLPPYPSQKSG